MNKQITIITLGILMLTSVMAMYAGDTITFETNLTNPVYTVTGNTSNLEGLVVEYQNGNITISPALNYKPDNFTMVFFDEVTREVEKIIYRGGGSSTKIKYVDRNVTVFIPIYNNTIKEVEIEVEKIVNNTTILETGYDLWHILLGLGLGLAFGYFIFKFGDKGDKEQD